MDKTKIEWTDASWNPLRGCSRVSAGCVNCYAERMAWRSNKTAYNGLVHWKNGGPKWTGVVRELPELLDQPLRWTKPRRVFVNSMSDLFHESVSYEFIDKVFAVMAVATRHTFQILTKRPERMADYMHNLVAGHMYTVAELSTDPVAAMGALASELPHVWLGVSAEDQATANERIPVLLETPAAVRWVSYEPALGPIDFTSITPTVAPGFFGDCLQWAHRGKCHVDEGIEIPALDWIVVGGESGPGARPFEIQWARDTVRQCRDAGVPVFVKQIGAEPRGWCASALHADPDLRAEVIADTSFCDAHEASEGSCGGKCQMLTSRKGSDMSEWPEDIRVREYPQ